MLLREAKHILEKNGYKLIKEDNNDSLLDVLNDYCNKDNSYSFNENELVLQFKKKGYKPGLFDYDMELTELNGAIKITITPERNGWQNVIKVNNVQELIDFLNTFENSFTGIRSTLHAEKMGWKTK